MGRKGKMVVTVWFGLPEGDDVRTAVSDEEAGKMVLGAITEAVEIGTMLGGLVGAVAAMEIHTPAVEATPDELAGLIQRGIDAGLIPADAVTV